ncbi:excinuclease ABC subunit UvrC [Candidatus Saccharibacteria bacterium]|nr:excinuclease ABC subunit UvrC [Candidatus Saccharibacteria bacterium]
MNHELKKKIANLPHKPGVYFHKDVNGEVIYVGKAAILKNRVRHYFQFNSRMDPKTKALVAEIYDTDWVETDSEVDALFLEAEMVKRYMPRYNILLRDDKSLMYIRIDMKSDYPTVSFTRHPLDDGADYFGPFYNGFAVKKALRYLRRIFPYYQVISKDRRPDLYAHLGLTPDGMSSADYKANLRKLIEYIKGNRVALVKEIERDMKNAAINQRFEQAAALRNKLRSLLELQNRVMFGDKEFLDISKDQALSDLVDLFNLRTVPIRIEGYDISHISGSNVVASMVVFKNGASNRADYRKFKIIQDKNDDFANMSETITRRFSAKNIKSWGRPDLVLIDGGKGQLSAAIEARNLSGFRDVPFIGLAKKDEQIITKDLLADIDKIKSINGVMNFEGDFRVINLPKNSHVIMLLQRIRDESHRFAVSYHSSLRIKKQTLGQLDEIIGIGPKTKSKLLRKFGSLSSIKKASFEDLASLVGETKANIIIKALLTP